MLIYLPSVSDAFFWIGYETPQPSPQGILLPYPDDRSRGPDKVLQRYNGADIVLRLPAGLKVQEMKWLSIWCRRFTVNFGDVFIPERLVPPRKVQLGKFSTLAHGVSSGNIVILNTKTFYIPNFHYDGGGPDAFFWVGNGSLPSPNGVKVPDETGSDDVLGGYRGKDIEITLPGSLTVYDIDWLSVWCVQYRHNFGWVAIPPNLDNIPPYLELSRRQDQAQRVPSGGGVASQLTNCRTLVDNKLRVSWGSDSHHIYVELSAEISEDDWMGFGLSGDQSRPLMKGADVVVAFYDAEEGTYRAQDYIITEKAQCSRGQGVCVDEEIGGRNDAQVISGKRQNGVTTVTFKRPIITGDNRADRPYIINGGVQVIAAIGPLNSRKQANYHSRGWGAGVIDFGAINDDRCADRSVTPVVEVINSQPWPRRTISGTNQFEARIGPTGGKRGYQAVTDIASWGIAWWINGQLIPELYVRRGETYTFIVEGGNDPSNPAEYHPLYITDDKEGGFANKDAAGRRQERVFAGVNAGAIGGAIPTAAGRACNYKPRSGIDMADKVATFEEYAQTLEVKCQPGQPARLVWTVQADTPETVYYQCYTHRNLGWKIHVLDPEESLQERQQDDNNDAATARPVLVSLLAAALAALLAGW
ncbi:Protein Skeletor, isoforms B/C [Amphibalanus amphitrite]|uniref:Protein Skeletor, isoforms B/C n=1 Tax=Amphibalanus amphitrite TaxID=1232801 RepID=A0A6A4VSM9_AMPAM|nr:Protein Skeletor, isoforms B/C [Amphibalanus amphitrite]